MAEFLIGPARVEPDIHVKIPYQEAKALYELTRFSLDWLTDVIDKLPQSEFGPNTSAHKNLKKFFGNIGSLSSVLNSIEAAQKVMSGPYELTQTVRQWRPKDRETSQ